MALKFRLRGLAETFIDEIVCPCCGKVGNDDEHFSTEFTRVSFDGIIVIVQCRTCNEIFVPGSQRFGVIDRGALEDAVNRDSEESGEPIMASLQDVRLAAEKLNAERKGGLH